MIRGPIETRGSGETGRPYAADRAVKLPNGSQIDDDEVATKVGY